MTDTVVFRAGIRHAEVIRGAENLATFLEIHLDLPLGDSNPLDFHVCGGSDAEERAEVDRIAAILGVEAGYAHHGTTHYKAVRDFGGGLVYQATAVSRAFMAEYDAFSSYRGAVQPESRAA